MSQFVIQLLFLSDGPSEHDGRYVFKYDPDYHEGLGRVWSTPDSSVALHFETVGEAMQFWTQTSAVKPLREDGRPNKPLTAFTVSVYDLDKQERANG